MNIRTALIAAFFVMGCGKKAPPPPPPAEVKEAVPGKISVTFGNKITAKPATAEDEGVEKRAKLAGTVTLKNSGEGTVTVDKILWSALAGEDRTDERTFQKDGFTIAGGSSEKVTLRTTYDWSGAGAVFPHPECQYSGTVFYKNEKGEQTEAFKFTAPVEEVQPAE